MVRKRFGTNTAGGLVNQEQPMATTLSRALDGYRRAANLSFEQILRHAQRQQPPVTLSKSTLSEWCSGRSVPRSGPAFRCVTALLDARSPTGPDGRRVPWEVLRKAAEESRDTGRHGEVPTAKPFSTAGQRSSGQRARLGRVPSTVSAYIEREHGEALAQKLSTSDRPASSPSSTSAVAGQILTGTGGTGKSQLAAHYCHTMADDADLVLWVVANSTPAVTGAYAQAARALDLGVAEDDTRFAAEQFLNWLRETTCSWLVVLDDVLSPGALDGWWPPQQTEGRGRVIVTTRSRERDLETLSGHPFLPVGIFTPAE